MISRTLLQRKSLMSHSKGGSRGLLSTIRRCLRLAAKRDSRMFTREMSTSSVLVVSAITMILWIRVPRRIKTRKNSTKHL